MKISTFLLIIFSFLFTHSIDAQYTVGESVNDTLFNSSIRSISGNCSPYPDERLTVIGPYFPYVTGLELNIIITEINATPGSISTDNGTLSVGDSLPINDATDTYSFYFNEASDFRFMLVASGIPEVEGECYPCGFSSTSMTLSACYADLELYAYYEDCFVEGQIDGTAAEDIDQLFICAPNPTTSILNIQSICQIPITNVSILNVQGQHLSTIFVYSLPAQIDLSTFPAGLYFIQIQTAESIVLKEILKI